MRRAASICSPLVPGFVIFGTVLVSPLSLNMEDMKVEDVKAEQKDTGENEVCMEEKPEETTEKEDLIFPSTLEGFNYAFNEKGQLRHTESGERFVFSVKDNFMFNQKRYEALGELLTTYVYELLEKEGELQKVHIPVDASEDEPQGFIFLSKDALSNPDKLLILIHGSGVVRAGQWARRLIINDCLDSGTQLPFIKKAMQEGYGVIVLNTNQNSVVSDVGTRTPIRHSSTPSEHAEYVWKEFVTKAAAKHITIIAHSYGGIVTTDLAMQYENDFEHRVFAIALTDSVHSLQHQDCPESTMVLFEKIAQNWVSSDEPLDTLVASFRRDCTMVSAGHPKHENTSWSSFSSIFKFLADRYNQVTHEKKEEEEEEEEIKVEL